ncbi:MAG: carbohydrate binding domain-containing protein, partial [Verrucomicrobiota bacterium]
DGIAMTELEYSINDQNIWYPLDSSNSGYLEAYYNLGEPYLITFRARAVDIHDLSSNWIYLEYQRQINLVENGDFEEGMTGWESWKNGQVLTLCPWALSGNSSLKVSTPGIVPTEGIYSIVGYPAEKGKTYIASAYVACDSGQGGKVRICLWGSKSGWTYANQTTELYAGWQKISVTKTITEDNETLYITLLTWEAQAINLYVDRIELMEVEDYKTVYNGDFEEGVTGWGSWKNGQVLTLCPWALSGNSSLKITTPGLVPTEGIGSSVGYPVEKGKTYIASAYVACDSGQHGKVRICLAGTKSGWTYANQTTELYAGWQKISVTKTITEDNETLYITLLTWEAQAINLYVDRIELTEVKDYKTVYNGDFEEGTTGWESWKNGQVLTLSPYALSGNSSLKVTTPGIVATEGICSSVAYPVEKGKTYTASAYVRGDPGQQGMVRICLAGTKGGWTYANQTTELNTEWQKISVTKTITEDNETLYITLLTWEAQAINLYVDRVELTKENKAVGNWKLDEGAGATARDSSGTGNNGVLQGNPQWANGWINGALSFNGSNYVDCGSNSSLKVSAITMAAWVYSPTTNFAGPNEIAGAEGAYGFNITDNKIWVHINTVNQGWHWCQHSDALTWDGWHHVAFTYDGVNTVKCYRDGVLIFTDTASSSGNLQWAAPKLYIGQVNIGSGERRLFKGMIDEVKIYNHPLTTAEIINEWQRTPQ